MYKYLTRTENAPLLARSNTTRRWVFFVLLASSIALMAAPHVFHFEPLTRINIYLLASAVFLAAIATQIGRGSDYVEIDADSYAAVLDLAKSNEHVRLLLESWLKGGELFLTYRDLNELREQSARRELAVFVGADVGDGAGRT